MIEAARLQSLILASPLLAPIIRNWPRIGLPDCWLVAGAIAQTVWNDIFDQAPNHGIADVDLIYFDAADLTELSESRHAARIQEAFTDLPVRLDVKNEARVHQWYEAKFGYPIMPYTSAIQAISTFPTTATSIGFKPQAEGPALCAPFGTTDLFDAIVRPNKTQITRAVYETKVSRWSALWPKLRIVAWDDPSENETMISLSPIRIAAALIHNEANHVLLVRKRGTSFFMQPGGKIEAHETPRAALKRELQEELNLSIDEALPHYLGKFVARAAGEEGRLVEAETFGIKITGPVAPAGEIEDIAWVDPFAPPPLKLAELSRDHILPLARRRSA